MADPLPSPASTIHDDTSSTDTASTDDSLMIIPYKILTGDDGEERNPKFSTFDFPFTLTTLPIAHATLETIQVHEYYIEELHNLVYYGLKDLARKNATLNNTVLKKVKAPTSKYVFEDPHVNASAKKSDAKGVKGGKVAKAGKGKAKVGGKGGEEDDEKPIPKGAIRKWGREMGNLMKKIEGWEGEFEELGGMVRGEMEACNGRVWKKVGGAWRSVKP
ncbi:MAG: hypothetical protein LQ350_005476 [Teloschistes chrysophthalmus]|nr:MAG: hypothetical protein LQ350_005476 [Niorma chrysophthalma]